MDFKEKLMNLQVDLKAPKNLRNSFGNYNYRNAEGILEAVKPLLTKYGLSLNISDKIELIGDRFYVVACARVMDIASEQSCSAIAYAREPESKKGMDESQITGAASSYARKYALNGLFLLDDTKDADTDEYQKTTQHSGKSAPKKATPAPAPAPAPTQAHIICADCGNEITSYQGQPAAKIAKATATKYGVPICMDCSAKRRAKATPVEVPPEDAMELPFEIEE